MFPSDCAACRAPEIELRRTDGDTTWNLRSVVGGDGSFTLPPVPDGDYKLRLAAGSTGYVSEITANGTTSRGDMLRLRGNVNEETLILGIARTDAAVSGRLEASAVLSGKSGVVLLDVKTGAVEVAKLDQSAAFTFAGLAPGEYRLYAWRDIEQAEYRSRRYLSSVQDQATSVSVFDSNSRINDLRPQLIER